MQRGGEPSQPEQCLCFHALSRDHTRESRQAGQRQLTEGAEEAGTSASKYGLSSQVTRTARTRGSWMFIPQKTSSGTHKPVPFQPLLLPAADPAPMHLHTTRTCVFSVPPVCTHDRVHTSRTERHLGTRILPRTPAPALTHTNPGPHPRSPGFTHTQGSHSQCPTLQLHSWLIFKAFAWLSSGKYISSHTFRICYLQLSANFPLKDGTQERPRA